MKHAIQIILALLFASINAVAEPIDHSEKAWNEWKKDSPPAENSWLTLAGLFWLKPGLNSIGSAADNTHIFPAGTPAHIGTLELKDNAVYFTRNSDTPSAKDTLKIKLAADTDSEILFDHFAFRIIEREKTFAIRLQDFKNPAIKKFKPSVYYPWQKKYILEGTFIPEKNKKQLQIQTVYGTLRPMPAAGWVEFKLNGKRHRLHAVDSGKGNPLFIMFKDRSSGSETYGAGRYLYIDRPNEKGEITIDFNRAYNPPCAITDFATCPLPPKSNTLKIKIAAGEKYTNDH